MKRIVLISTACVLALCAVALCGCSGKKDKLVVAMELAYPPFETKDASGDPMGVSVDLAKAIGEHLGLEVEIVDTAWEGLIPSLMTGKADMIISSMTVTEKRKEEVNFSDPYANAYLAVLANKTSGIKSIDDLNEPGKKVAVKTGSTGFIYAQENLTNAEIIALADESACVTEVSQGKADGFLYDQLTVYRNNRNNPDTTTAIFIPFQNVEHWGIAINKDNTELLSRVNEFLAKYRSEGGFDAITEKHLKEEKKAFDQFGFRWFFDVE
ncbi:MAG: transporter substrate-binding domain-containing protein [Oscillospiraceae bacterium]|nr:transporter substrate-binding domain-containing protein [Oscillospiraceae bacterium]